MPQDKKDGKKYTDSGIEIKELYGEKDQESFRPEKNLGDPGKYPYTRGVYPTMYRGKPWTIRQYAGFGTAEESNQRYLYLLAQGQTGLSVAFDLPTQLGIDSDSPLARGEVGKVGVAVDTLEDMEILFRNIPLDKVSISMTINATAGVILGMYLALAEKRGIPWQKLRGTIQNDILKEYIARGTYIFPPRESLKIINDIISFCREKVPQWNTMSISGYHIREAGATAAQELAFTFANAFTYVDSVLKTGLHIDHFAPRLSFFLAAHNHLFEEVAKFRAARRIWAHNMREKFKASDARSWKFRFHTQTSGSTLLAQQPENNVVRVTLQALASILGGTQSLHTNSRDEALALPSEESARIALRTQQIILHESGIPDSIDPFGGSYLIESLTDAMEEKVYGILDKIDSWGGMLAAIEKGFIQKEIQESAYRYQKDIETHKKIFVGLNRYRDEQEKLHFDIQAFLEDIEKIQKKNLAQRKKSRPATPFARSLESLLRAALNGQNLMPSIIDAAKSGATLGEITDVLKNVYGVYTEAPIF
ncbi:MAG: methylmalonyl-CoA mutase [Candidatus Aminicenantes bacterium]|nr:methylmalonyl-CoA mutase [Candidatus Aminicenantes bacterium]